MKKVEVTPYNPEWPKQYSAEAARIKKALGDECTHVYHVGSTSVPGLCAKPKIDIIVEARDPQKALPLLESIGYEYRGEYNIPMHYGFRKRENPSVNLHMYEKGHPEIELNIAFRNYLREHPALRDEYGSIKENLVKDDESHVKQGRFTGYNLGKNGFIQKILRATGYNRLRFVYCTHHNEWEAAKKASDATPSDNLCHLIIYKGADIIGYARVEQHQISIFHVEKPYEEESRAMLNQWLERSTPL